MPRRFHPRRLGFSTWVLACALCAATLAVASADERPLAALVPADVGVCLEARGLAAAVRQFRASRHFERTREFPPWRRWREKQGQELADLADQVGTAIGVKSSDLWDKVAGHQALVGIWPRAAAQEALKEGVQKDSVQKDAAEADPTSFVFLLRASDAEALRKAAEGFRSAQSLFDRVSWKTAEHGGASYHVGTRPDKRPPMRLAVLGSLVIVSDDERLFHRVLDLTREGTTPAAALPGSLAGLPAYAAAAKQMPPGAALALFVNPRAWDSVIQADAASASPAEQPHKKLLLATWQAVEACWATVELTPRVRLQAVVNYDAKRMPAPVAEFVGCFRGPSAFLGKVPDNALLAAAARIDADRFITWARKYGEKQPKQPASAAGHDTAGSDDSEVIVSLLRLLGPDLGVYLQPADAGDGAHWLQWAAAVAVRPQMPPERESLQLLQAAVQPLLAGVAKTLSESASSRLAGLFLGDGLRSLSDSLRLSRSAISSLTLADGRLWVAGSERALHQAQSVGGDKSLAGSKRWTGHLTEAMRDPSHWLYVDCAGWDGLLERHADALVAATVRERGVDDASARRGLLQLRSLLKLADTLVAALKIDDGQIAVSLSASIE